VGSKTGITGCGNRHYPDDPGLLRGVLASEEPKVYPEDRCPDCEKLGRLSSDENCFRHHWNKKKGRPE
jgi:hypothetical protein